MRSLTSKTATTSITSSNDEIVSKVSFDPLSSGNIKSFIFFSRRLCKTREKTQARLDLCSVSAGAGSLSYDTFQK